jgi:acetylornithine aminotransferase/acetylornithine/N-succinyldiaminopimelate aminotransferase
MENKIKSLIQAEKKYIMPTYSRYPLCFERGRGVYLWGKDGKKYLDFLTGIGVSSLGHSHPVVVKVLKKQAGQLLHTSNLYHIEPQVKVARILSTRSFGGRVFFCNSGAEANEAAIKLIRRAAKLKFGSHRYEIIAMKQSFHGRTLATLTATGQKKYQKHFSPLLPGFKYVKFNDFSALLEKISPKTAGIILEPIQGEGGINLAQKEYLKKIRKLCTEKEIFLAFDEVQCGLGKTGYLFAYQYYGVEPDLLTLAKALGGGVPIGALIAREELAGYFAPGTHASTFGGNFLATAVAEVVLKEIIKLLPKVKKIGDYFHRKLTELQQKYPVVKEIRGVGLIWGVELVKSVKGIIDFCHQNQILVGSAGENVLRFLPPLIVEPEHIDRLIEVLKKSFKN